MNKNVLYYLLYFLCGVECFILSTSTKPIMQFFGGFGMAGFFVLAGGFLFTNKRLK